MILYAFKKYKKEKLRIEYQKLYSLRNFEFNPSDRIKIINRSNEIQEEFSKIDISKKIKKIRKEEI